MRRNVVFVFVRVEKVRRSSNNHNDSIVFMRYDDPISILNESKQTKHSLHLLTFLRKYSVS